MSTRGPSGAIINTGPAARQLDAAELQKTKIRADTAIVVDKTSGARVATLADAAQWSRDIVQDRIRERLAGQVVVIARPKGGSFTLEEAAAARHAAVSGITVVTPRACYGLE